MSEQKRSFMEELDLWVDANVVGPLFTSARDYDDQHTYDWDKTVEQVSKAIRTKVLDIRTKVLDSYHNGQAAGPSRAPRGAYKPRGK